MEGLPSQYTLAHRQPDDLQASAFHRARIATCTKQSLKHWEGPQGVPSFRPRVSREGGLDQSKIWMAGVPSFLAWAVFPSQMPSTAHYREGWVGSTPFPGLLSGAIFRGGLDLRVPMVELTMGKRTVLLPTFL